MSHLMLRRTAVAALSKGAKIHHPYLWISIPGHRRVFSASVGPGTTNDDDGEFKIRKMATTRNDIVGTAALFINGFHENASMMTYFEEYVNFYIHLFLVAYRDSSDVFIAESKSSVGRIIGMVQIDMPEISPVTQRHHVSSSSNILDRLQESNPSLSNLIVDKSARRKGLAQRLMRHVESHVRDGNLNSIYLKVERENHAALTLYQDQLGYAPVKTSRSLRNKPYLLLWKKVTLPEPNEARDSETENTGSDGSSK